MRAGAGDQRRDNVATALEALETGRTVDARTVRRSRFASRCRADTRSRCAPSPRASGVIKYGSPIGTATADIAAGAHVHTHNVASSRGRGDLPVRAAQIRRPRLAEPPDVPQTAAAH